MKNTHRPDLFMWSRFDEARNVDFNALAWIREGGNVLVDPLPMSDHDRAHLESLGGAKHIVVTNSDHLRDAVALAERFGAELAGPAQEPDLPVERRLAEGDEVVPGLKVFELDGSKTPGELALLLEERTLVTGDLIRAHRGGELMILPPDKLADRDAARKSVRRMAALVGLEAVLVGDGWPVFTGGGLALASLAAML
ncbi:MAG: MBL fold metallo-hydrolase [Deltaproteobacteria bacterium]